MNRKIRWVKKILLQFDKGWEWLPMEQLILLMVQRPCINEVWKLPKRNMLVIKTELEDIRQNQIPALEKQLTEAGAPWIEGQDLPDGN